MGSGARLREQRRGRRKGKDLTSGLWLSATERVSGRRKGRADGWPAVVGSEAGRRGRDVGKASERRARAWAGAAGVLG